MFTSHPALLDALAREGWPTAHERLADCGARFGSAEMFALGDAANRNPPHHSGPVRLRSTSFAV
ncbi:MAG TPA: hypothetical protein VG994_05900, partial [Steroidobacteraceae bacterium]|nr:hypothetical protein [Steroidobacteraceae bacterium]